MKFAFCLFNYFPFGGLQRDFLRIACECVKRGHAVDVYTMKWEGENNFPFSINVVPVKGWQNHTRCESFVEQVEKKLAGKHYDCVVGFNKMPGLDIYYAADTCYQAKSNAQRSTWYQLTPRYRHLIQYEKAVFGPENKTQILLIADKQQKEFQKYYQTPTERFHLLPPGIAKDRMAPQNAEEIREKVRREWRLNPDEFLLLLVGSGFKTKGLDRCINAMAALPEDLKNKTQLFVIGKDHAEHYQRQAAKLRIADRIKFLGGRTDVPEFMLAADLLLHPAYNENTGTVLLEAIISGLPVLTNEVCGYASYVRQAKAGIVMPVPFQQIEFNHTLVEMLLTPERERWKRNGLVFARTADIYSMPERAVDIIESMKTAELVMSDDNAAHSKKQEAPMGIFGTYTFDQIMALRGEVYRELENRRTQRITIENKNYFIKQHFGIGWKEIFKNLVQGKLPILSAKNEWQAILRLQSLAIHTPEVVAYGCRGKNPATRKSFLITKELDEKISLEDFCVDWKDHPPLFQTKLKLINEVAEIARTLHQNGINHRDFYICHFLLGDTLCLIDLHRAQIREKTPLRWQIKDLAGLYFSTKNIGLTQRDLYRFMKVYSKEPLHTILSQQAKLWQQVKQRGERLYQKHEK